MRILFIENRTSTILLHEGARALVADGHDIHWLVQNHVYAPRAANVHTIAYPKAGDLSSLPLHGESLEHIARTDRGVLHFGVEPRHYPYYSRRVTEVIEHVRPDTVFGESTNFHELMAIRECKRSAIPYIAPLETRYPAGRIVFYRYDTFEPFGGCRQPLAAEATRELLCRIVKGDVLPAYMEPPARNWQARMGRIKEKLRLTRGWLQGERFLTPSPLVHLRLNKVRDRTRAGWDALAESREGFDPKRDRSWVLYPLQMQPESNLDVFGQPWNDQADIMVRAAQALGRIGARLVVKPNPKSKYEMMPALLEAARRHANIVPLKHSHPMAGIFPDAPLVLSVTGTVIIESIFNCKPVAVLGDHEMARLAGVTRIGAPEHVARVLEDVRAGRASQASSEDAEATLQWLHQTSYAVRLFDPVLRPDLLSGEGVRQLQAAFRDVLAQAVPSAT